MMRRLSSSIELRLMFLAGLVAVAATGCAKKPDADANAAGRGTGSEFDDANANAGAGAADTSGSGTSLSPVYFDLDRSDIKSEFEPVLEGAAAQLKGSGGSAVIEGHCDERGSDEYNVALGERRAVAVRKYLYNLGVPTSQLSVVSYGEARPAVTGSGESVWSLNRRAEIKLQ